MSSGSLLVGTENIPLGYVTPPFPGLGFRSTNSLYSTGDIYLFTLYWSLIMSAGFHISCAILAAISLRKPRRALILVPLYGVIGAIHGCITGSVAGLFLGGIYIAGGLKMSTWVPFVWSLIPVTWLIMRSYSNTSRYI